MIINRKILNLLPKSYKNKSILFVVFLIIASILETLGIGLILPLLELIINGNFSRNFFNLNLQNIFGSIENFIIIKTLIISILFLYFLKSIYLVFFSFWQAKFANNVFKDLSCKLFNIYLNQPVRFFYLKNSSELLRNTLMECKNYGQVVNLTLKIIAELIISLFIFLLVLYIEPIKTLILSLTLIVLSSLYYFATKTKIYKLGLIRMETTSKQIKILNESFGSIRDIKIKSSENFFLKLYNFITQKFIVAAYVQQTIIEALRIIIEFIFLLILLSSLMIYLNSNYSLTPLLPIIGLYVVTAFRLVPSVMKILNMLQQIKGLSPSVDFLNNEFETLDLDKGGKNSKPIRKNLEFNKNIKIQNVKFEYNNRKYIFENFTQEIEKNSCIGIIGQSGSGKSTLIDLITGLISPIEGKILVDDIDIKENIKSWQSKIGYVSQTAVLLDNSIKQNVAFGEEEDQIDTAKVLKVLNDTQILNFIKNLEKGIETTVGERGLRLSGGQKQRIAIARELYRNPELLILDESTSALDEETEDELLRCLENLKKKITIIIVSHRKNTLKNCSKIIKI